MELLIDAKILEGVKVDDIAKEIEEAEFFKMKIMDAIANIKSSKTLSASIMPTQTTSFSHPDPLASHTQHEPLDSTHQGISNTQHQMAGLPLNQGNTTSSIPPAPPLSPSTNSTPHNIENPGVQTTKSQLPKIVLPKFIGEVTQFRSFWDSFESTVHLNPVLTKIDKFNYLTSLLKGSASRAIAGLPVMEENYDAAMDIICKRFGKPQQLISAHIDELLKISACPSDKPHQLRYFYDKLSVNIRALEALGVKPDQYGTLLIPIIMAKLPLEIRVHVARNTTQDVWNIESILNVIQSKIEAREISDKVKAMTSSIEPKRPSYQKPGNSTTSSFLTGSQLPFQTPKCVYCSERHFSASRKTVTDCNARKSILKHDKQCFTCLGKGHNSEQCGKRCRKCSSQKHHQSICSASELNNSPRYQNQASPLGNQSVEVVETTGTTTATTTSENTQSKPRVLLQTATRSTKVRVLFDSGSQRSCVAESLRSRLQLRSLQSERINLNTFGESKFRKQSCDVVNVQLRKLEYDEPITVAASTFPVICSTLPAHVSTSYAHLHGLELADEPSSSENSIELLIGSDYYWLFVSGETRRGEEGPIAVDSKLGRLLSGTINEVSCGRCYVTDINLIIEGEKPLFQPSEDDMLANSLKRFWDTESVGISDTTANEEELFEIDVRRKGNHYEVKLPWKENTQPSSNGYQLRESHLRSLHHNYITSFAKNRPFWPNMMLLFKIR